MRTQVGIVGGGPAGLLLAHLLHLQGIDSVVLEARSEEYVVDRVRAGVLEQGTVDLMAEIGLGDRMQREGLIHRGINISFAGTLHRIDLHELTGGRAITVYGQNEVQKDLNQARRATGRPIFHEVEGLSVHDFDSRSPRIQYRHRGDAHELECDFIAGCDGFHGVCRPSIPAASLTTFERVYPFGWLGILAQAAPALEELVYSWTERGFALFSMRSPTITRLYLQCAPDEDIAHWSDDRIWNELNVRLATRDGWKPNMGPVLQKGVTGMRSFVVEPMRFGRLFLAGDAAHIVPPTGAKGLNLAAADVYVLAQALAGFYKSGGEALLDAYSDTCLRRVWRAQRFSWWMTSMLHLFGNENAFDRRRQLAELDYLTSSRAAMTSLAENYVGFPII
ncbi:MAG: 4-hydroxybenzoate 3-monooxygenase [Bryobacteraceae bacterium]|jgi:p-hydroxybenzoate 3-monooxygenase